MNNNLAPVWSPSPFQYNAGEASTNQAAWTTGEQQMGYAAAAAAPPPAMHQGIESFLPYGDQQQGAFAHQQWINTNNNIFY
jgi:hypothetical protein